LLNDLFIARAYIKVKPECLLPAQKQVILRV